MTDIDARDLLCPLPVLKLRKALKDVAEGEAVRLLATDPAAVVDVPHFCTEAGHGFEGVEQADGYAIYTVRKG